MKKNSSNLLCGWNSENRAEPVCWNTLVPHIRFGRMSIDFFIENIVYKNVIESDYALKIMLYMTSLFTQKDVIHHNAYRPRTCIPIIDLLVNRFFSIVHIVHGKMKPLMVTD